MIEVVWRYDHRHASSRTTLTTAAEARQALVDGNHNFAGLLRQAEIHSGAVRKIVQLSAHDLGLTSAPDELPQQLPFGAVLSCSDARVPVEMLFWQEANDLFVVRTAGNTPGAHIIGSLAYVVHHLPSVHLLAVLGHTGCGAVTAAVDTFLQPASYMSITADMPLRSIIDGIMPAVSGAAAALQHVYGESVRHAAGYRAALTELSVAVNAALTAVTVREIFKAHLGPQLGVVFGVFSLSNHSVGVPEADAGEDGWRPGLQEPPAVLTEFFKLAEQMAQSAYIARYLRP